MKETGIIMSGDHPKLILEGRKTQTRRVITPQPPKTLLNPTLVAKDPASPSGYSFVSDEYGEIQLKCPFGQVGDRLWVRETFCDSKAIIDRILYKADGVVIAPSWKWKPSIHLFKKDARIWLEITEVRVE